MLPRRNLKRIVVKKVAGGSVHDERDFIAVEEPLEIRVTFNAPEAGGSQLTSSLSVTMRTPGHDYELAAGFLYTEGILNAREQLHEISYCVGADKSAQQYNIVSVRLRPGVTLDPARLQRNFYMSSSCGVCGKSSIEAVQTSCPRALPVPAPTMKKAVLTALPQTLRDAQELFEKTGGIHAAGLFSRDGKLLSLHEDIGRHNAVDKVVGEQFLADRLPLHSTALLVSGRASFELVQKTVMAGIPILAAVGAPSSLAIELAQDSGLTLIGFLRGDRFNIYTMPVRIRFE